MGEALGMGKLLNNNFFVKIVHVTPLSRSLRRYGDLIDIEGEESSLRETTGMNWRFYVMRNKQLMVQQATDGRGLYSHKNLYGDGGNDKFLE